MAGRAETYFEDDFLYLSIKDVRLSDTGSYMCISNGERSPVRLIIIGKSGLKLFLS